MLAKVFSAAVVGLEGLPVEVEVYIQNQGLPSFTIVGLPDKAVEEAKERVRSAIKNTGCDFPQNRNCLLTRKKRIATVLLNNVKRN
jgi:magnesium chelatase family protein